MYMSIIMSMNIYITKDNEQFLHSIRGEESMSGLINRLLDDYRGGVKLSYHNTQLTTPADAEVRAVVDDPYKNLIFDSIEGAVADTELGEYLEESTPEMIKELKRRNQVR